MFAQPPIFSFFVLSYVCAEHPKKVRYYRARRIKEMQGPRVLHGKSAARDENTRFWQRCACYRRKEFFGDY